jgi:hypothetical protein
MANRLNGFALIVLIVFGGNVHSGVLRNFAPDRAGGVGAQRDLAKAFEALNVEQILIDFQ